MAIIQEGCGCSFPSHFISSPILQCPDTNPDSSKQVIFRAQFQEGGGSPVTYNDAISYLEDAKGSYSFNYKVRKPLPSLYVISLSPPIYSTVIFVLPLFCCRGYCSPLIMGAVSKLTAFKIHSVSMTTFPMQVKLPQLRAVTWLWW